MHNIKLNSDVGVLATIEQLRDGAIIATRVKKNLTNDSLMDALATLNGWNSTITARAFSAPITVSRSVTPGNTMTVGAATASTVSAFFDPADAGRVVAFPGGERRISSYVSSTLVNLSGSAPTYTGDTAGVYYVSATSFTGGFANWAQGTVSNSSFVYEATDKVAATFTALSAVLGSPVDCYALQWGASSLLWGTVNISPLFLAAGDQIRLTLKFTVGQTSAVVVDGPQTMGEAGSVTANSRIISYGNYIFGDMSAAYHTFANSNPDNNPPTPTTSGDGNNWPRLSIVAATAQAKVPYVPLSFQYQFTSDLIATKTWDAWNCATNGNESRGYLRVHLVPDIVQVNTQRFRLTVTRQFTRTIL
jgi:hypothetical protein